MSYIGFGCSTIQLYLEILLSTDYRGHVLYFWIKFFNGLKFRRRDNRPLTRENSYCFQRVLAIAVSSVSLSVCPSHGWISQKRCKLGSPNFHHRLPGRL